MSARSRYRLLNDEGNGVGDGEIGELYSATPYAFDGYWNLPQKTAEAFRGDYLTVGDLAKRDADGFYTLVDRKNNMINFGRGKTSIPPRVENALGSHEAVKDVAVIGARRRQMGRAVCMVSWVLL